MLTSRIRHRLGREGLVTTVPTGVPNTLLDYVSTKKIIVSTGGVKAALDPTQCGIAVNREKQVAPQQAASRFLQSHFPPSQSSSSPSLQRLQQSGALMIILQIQNQPTVQ